jgi:hypothetical protein
MCGEPRLSASADIRRSTRRTIAGLMVLMLFGCAMHEVLHTEPGVDITGIKPGMARAEVEAVVGAPRSQWTTSAGVRYSLYRYYAGKDVSASGAFVVGFFEIATLGVWELARAYNPTALDFSEEGKKYRFMAVSYDSEDRVVGTFSNIDEFALLPVDGHPPANEVAPIERAGK